MSKKITETLHARLVETMYHIVSIIKKCERRVGETMWYIVSTTWAK